MIDNNYIILDFKISVAVICSRKLTINVKLSGGTKSKFVSLRDNLPTELQHGACTSEDVGVWTVVISIV
jgi:hypothetical protein